MFDNREGHRTTQQLIIRITINIHDGVTSRVRQGFIRTKSPTDLIVRGWCGESTYVVTRIRSSRGSRVRSIYYPALVGKQSLILSPVAGRD